MTISKPKRRGHKFITPTLCDKNSISKIYRYPLGYAMLSPSGSKLGIKDWRSPNKQSEGTKIGALSPLRRFGQVPSYCPHRFVSHSAMLLERSISGCRTASTRPIVFSMITGSYFCRRRRLTSFEPDERSTVLYLIILPEL